MAGKKKNKAQKSSINNVNSNDDSGNSAAKKNVFMKSKQKEQKQKQKQKQAFKPEKEVKSKSRSCSWCLLVTMTILIGTAAVIYANKEFCQTALDDFIEKHVDKENEVYKFLQETTETGKTKLDELMRAARETFQSLIEEEDDKKRKDEELKAQNEAKEEEKRKAEDEARRKAEEEARKKAEEEKRLAEEKAKRKAEEEAKKKAEEAKRKAEDEAKKKAEEARKKTEEEVRKKAEQEAKKKAEEEAKRKAEEEAKKKVEEAKKKAEEEARRKAEEEEKRKAEEAKKKAEEEARRKAEEEAKKKAEEEAKRKAEEEARKKAEEEATKKAEEAKKKAEEEAKKKAEEVAKKKAEEEAKKKAEEEAKKKAEEEAKKKAEEEAKKKAEEEAKKKAEEEANKKAEEEEKKKAEEAKKKAEEEARKKADQEAKKKAEEEARKKTEQEAKKKAEEEARRKAEEESRKKAEEEATKTAEEAKKKAEEEAKKKAEEEAKKKAEEEAKKKAEEAKKKAEEEAKRKAEEKAKKKKEEEAKKKTEEEAKMRAEEEKKRKEEAEKSAYPNIHITNDNDYIIRKELDKADELYSKEKLQDALSQYDKLLEKNPDSPRANYGKAEVLNKMAETRRSNEFLESAIQSYQKVLDGEQVPDRLIIMAGRTLADRLQFRGWGSKATKTWRFLSERFPRDYNIRNQLGVSYLMSGNNQDAKQVFQEVLRIQPSDGFAKVHLGFIIKTSENNLEDSIQLMTDGINSEQPGTEDGRFYFHLGDALQRLNKTDEAYIIYKKGAKKQLFLSEHQRSLYNVDFLTGKPWWTQEDTGYQEYFKLLEENWKMIRDEGMAQIDKKTGAFLPEDENLREKGDWKQLTLYARGKKDKANCAKTPKTCELIDKIPDAKGCTRGQVKFSVMSPGVHVWPHCGPTNCRLRSHLGLVVPKGPKIRVKDDIRTWQEGKVIIFDDSFEHEVWHEGKELRLVLITDFWHPELDAPTRRSLSPI